MYDLINRQNFHQLIKDESKHLAPFSTLLMNVLQLTKINEFYADAIKNSNNAEEFIHLILTKLNIHICINEKELERIPLEGSFITVSNHPFGGIDGLILLHILLKKRPDFKVIANFLLQQIAPLKEIILPVNSFEYRNEASFTGLKTALTSIQKGCPIGLFPAGEVSTLHPKIGVVDKQWNISSIKLIKKAQVPVIPVFFEGENSQFFHLLGKIHPKLRTAKLPSEIFNKKNKPIRVSIGNAITVKEINCFTSIIELSNYIRHRTYLLKYTSSTIKNKDLLLQQNKKFFPIQPLLPSHVLAEEINQLSSTNLLMDNGTFCIYSAKSSEIPLVLIQICILREITFREVGEGTGKSIDTDKYDNYYHHLFLWDKVKQQVVGAYRIGKGEDVIKNFGRKGFYIHSLFKLKKPLLPILKQSLELGRSFVIKEYQRNPQPLFLLWKGILYFLIKNPSYRYLIGPVSISNDFSAASKELIVTFVKQNYYDNLVASYVVPRKKYKVELKQIDINALVDSAKNDFSKLDKLIGDIEPDKVRIPVLLKKYIKQNASIVGFNIDPLFNNALDGFVFLDLMKVPQNTIEQLSKDFNDSNLLNEIYNRRANLSSQSIL